MRFDELASLGVQTPNNHTLSQINLQVPNIGSFGPLGKSIMARTRRTSPVCKDTDPQVDRWIEVLLVGMAP